MKTIVALVDFSDVTPRVLKQARELTGAFDARLILLHIVPQEPAVIELGLASPTLMQPPSQERIEADYRRLAVLGDELAQSGVNVSVQQLEKGSAADVVTLCKHLESDLLVVGSHHHSALFDLFIGTFTGDILKCAKCPVLVVPAASHMPEK